MKRTRVKERRFLKPGIFLLTLEVGDLPRPRAGQFAMLRSWPGQDPLLARPFSIHDQEGSFWSFLIQVRGQGTKILSQLRAGDEVDLLGPLGKAFPAPQEKTVYLVAGGMGVAPFYLAAKELLATKHRCLLLYGARSQKDLVRLSAFKRLGLPFKVATEDGSRGHAGLVTDLLEKALEQEPAEVWACGPWPMLQAVAKTGRRFQVPVYLSLEARMACGLGLCLGCAVKRAGEGYLHVCSEGPVVRAEEVF